jgi:FKBP-type peptidyl-prolyl cis-trans isomerase 2
MKVNLKKPDGSVAEGETVPFNVDDERFGTYSPNVPPEHPLAGKTIKFKAVVHTIVFAGVNPETGIPEIQVMYQAVAGVE